MDGKLWWETLLYFAAGVASVMIPVVMSGGTLFNAQRSYTECISLQAPREECLKRYLLPEDK